MKNNLLILTNGVVQSMLMQSQGCPTETGGVLIGIQQKSLVLQAGEPGPAAEKQAARFTTDPDQDRNILENCRTATGRQVHVVGYWHKHPAGMIKPSFGDLTQAREILKAWQNAGDPDPQIIVIILQESHDPRVAIHSYVLKPGWPNFEPANFLIVEQNAQVVLDALQNEPPYLSGKSPEHIWSTPDFRFQVTPAGRRRLEEESQALKQAGWQVILRQSRPDARIVVELWKEQESFLLRLPREYPLNPPVWLDRENGAEKPPLQMTVNWNSDRSLVEWLVNYQPPVAAPQLAEPESMNSLEENLLWALMVGILFMAGVWFGRWMTWPR